MPRSFGWMQRTLSFLFLIRVYHVFFYTSSNFPETYQPSHLPPYFIPSFVNCAYCSFPWMQGVLPMRVWACGRVPGEWGVYHYPCLRRKVTYSWVFITANSSIDRSRALSFLLLSCWNLDWLDLVHVLYRQIWSLWIDVCHSHVTRRQQFMILPLLSGSCIICPHCLSAFT